MLLNGVINGLSIIFGTLLSKEFVSGGSMVVGILVVIALHRLGKTIITD